MQTHSPGFKSFGALARSALGSPDWPKTLVIEPRSLATMLSKLDRELEVGWLEDRPDVQLLLAKLLKCSADDIRPAGRAQARPDRKVRLADLQFGRAFDLADEELPPGIPGIVSEPEQWNQLWWLAPSGSGRTLSGSWLRARGRAQFRSGPSHQSIESAAAAEIRPPRTSEPPLFVELTTSTDSARRQSGWLLQGATRICVAAPFPPPIEERSAWTLVQSPPLDDFLTELVDWVASRLPPDGQFDPDQAIEWIERARASHPSLTSLGSVLGLCGALDELGMRATKALSPRDLAQRFIRRRVEQISETADSDLGWLRKNAFELLVGMARRALTDDQEPWFSPRNAEGWIALVPEEHRSGLDVEWLRLSLARAETPIRLLDVERAARHVPPGAFRIVRALRSAQLLKASADDDKLAPAPRWISGLVAESAIGAVVDGSPFEWGEALLRPHAAAEVAAALLGRISSGDTAPLSRAIELEADDSPAQAAALEIAFRVAGLALLGGSEIDLDLLQALWEEQSELWIELEGAPAVPRIGHAEADASSLLDLGSWRLAALAVSEALTSEVRFKANPLSPWQAGAPPQGCEAVLESIEAALERGFRFRDAWVLGAYGLVERLRASLGSIRADTPLALELPSMVVEEALHGVLGWERVSGLDARGAAAVVYLARRHQLALEKLGSELWRAWSEASLPKLEGSLLGERNDASPDFWSALPETFAARALGASALDELDWIAGYLGERQWAAIVKSAKSELDGARLGALCRQIPETWAEQWLLSEEPPLEHDALEALWRRFPELAARSVKAQFEGSRPEAAIRIATAAPIEQSELMLRTLEQTGLLGSLAGSARDELRIWLMAAIADRRSGWRPAYTCLAEIQR